MFDSTFHIPKGTAASLRTGGSTNAGAVFYNTSDSSVYTYTGTQWIKLRGTIIDTTSLSNRINLKLNISDTASMLSPYLRKVDTTNKFVTQVYKKNGSDSVFYVRGGNHLWAFNDSSGAAGGGGGGKIYYFNGGVPMGTFGGLTMYELGDTANTGAAANFTRATTGNIANFITDPGKPGLLQIPAGVWDVDAWLSETGGGSNHAEIWVEVEKWDGSTITTIATSPIEQITEGNTPNLYSWSVSIPTTTLAVTDRIIIQFYISNTNGKTVTLYTQNGYVGEVHTTFTTGIGAINGLTAPAQYLVTGTSGTDFNISSVTATHTFNLPTASATNRGALSSADWTAFNNKGSVSSVATNNATGITGGTITTTGTLAIDTTVISTRLWRQKGIDSVQSNLTAGLALKVNISDTSSMLSPYLRKIDTTAMLSPYARKNFINAGTGISYSSSTGTIANTAPDQTVAISSGTGISVTGTYPNFTITNTSPSSGGTVTSVATNNGTGITGGTITTAGTLAIDTVVISTRAWRQKGIDSVATLANTKVSSVSGTAPISSSGGTTPAISIPKATASVDGYLAYTDWNFFADKIGGSGTTNYIPKFTSSSAIGNSQVFDNGTNVGIGTATPAYKLDVSGRVNISNAASAWNSFTTNQLRIAGTASGQSMSISFTDNNNSNGWFGYKDDATAANRYFYWSANDGSSQQMILNSSGNLGLGVTPSAWSLLTALQISGGASLAGYGGATYLGQNFYYGSGGDTYISNGYSTRYTQFNGQHLFFTAPSGTAGNAISFTQAMTLHSSGNLSVGNTSDVGDRIYVSGNIRLTSGNAFKATYNNTDDYHGALSWATLQLGNNGENRIIGGRTAAGGSLRFYVNNTNDATNYATAPNGILA
jgi:hypothetical protein